MQPKVRSAAALPTLARPVPTTKLIQKTHKMSQGHEQHQALLAFAPAGAASQQPSLQRLVQQLAQSRISDCERIYLHIPGSQLGSLGFRVWAGNVPGALNACAMLLSSPQATSSRNLSLCRSWACSTMRWRF